MPMTKYEGITLTNKVLVLEESWIVNCILRECIIFYSGGAYDLVNATFQNCQWKFQGAANLTVQLLGMIGALPKSQTSAPVVVSSGPVN